MSTRFAAHLEWRSLKASSSASEPKSGGSIECFSSLCEMKKCSARFCSTSAATAPYCFALIAAPIATKRCGFSGNMHCSGGSFSVSEKRLRSSERK